MALYAASTGPVPIEHAIFSSPSEDTNFTVAVDRPSVPHVAFPMKKLVIYIGQVKKCKMSVQDHL